MKNSFCEEKHRTEVEQGEFCSKFTPNMWRSFASFIRAGTTNRPVTKWCDPSKAPPTYPLKYGTPQRYIFMGDEGWNPIWKKQLITCCETPVV